ncbi:MAG: alkylmercury lyase family protein [Geminicoccaceae bacterium]
MGQSLATMMGGKRSAIELRPGVVFPDWSAVRSPQAEEALGAHLAAIGFERRWSGYSAQEDRVRRAILEGYLQLGVAPALPWLAERTGLLPEDALAIVRRLAARDLAVLDHDGDRIIVAYPFTDRPTEHRVRLGERTLQAVCALDALGVGSMCRADVVIDSRCRACERGVRLVTRQAGARLATVDPRTTVVWSGLHYADGCAATSLCTVIAFFCSNAHLDVWRAEQRSDPRGYRLAPDDALQVGRALFGPALRSSPPARRAATGGSRGTG